MKNRLPDYIGLGARRCASSWLHYQLNQHPDIGKPSSGLHYFSNEYHRGLDWYKAELSQYSQSEVLLESSVSYLYPEVATKAAERMKSIIPTAKLFVVLRDPVERAYSDYLRSLRNREIEAKIPFMDAVNKYPELLKRGQYKDLLLPYIDLFGLENVKILFFQDIQKNPAIVLRDLAAYMNIRFESFASEIESNIPVTGRPKLSILNTSLHIFKSTMDTLAGSTKNEDRWREFKKRHMRFWHKVNEINLKPDALSKIDRIDLTQFFSADIKYIEDITNRSLRVWHE